MLGCIKGCTRPVCVSRVYYHASWQLAATLLWYWSLYFTNGSNALSPPAVSCCFCYGAHGRIWHVLSTYEEYKKLFMNEYDLINHKMCDCHLNKTSWQLWQKIIHLHPSLLSSYMRSVSLKYAALERSRVLSKPCDQLVWWYSCNELAVKGITGCSVRGGYNKP